MWSKKCLYTRTPPPLYLCWLDSRVLSMTRTLSQKLKDASLIRTLDQVPTSYKICVIHFLKWGHLPNQDTVYWPRVSILLLQPCAPVMYRISPHLHVPCVQSVSIPSLPPCSGNVLIETNFYDNDLLVSTSRVKVYYVWPVLYCNLITCHQKYVCIHMWASGGTTIVFSCLCE